MSAEKKEEKKEAAPAEELTPEQEAAKKKKKLLIFAILGAVLILGGGAGAFFAMKGGKKPAETEVKAGDHAKDNEAGHAADAPKDGHSADAPKDGHSADAPKDGHSADAPKDGHSADAPKDGHSADAPKDGHSADAPKDGHSTGDKKGEGKEEVVLDIDFGETYKLPPFSLNLGNALENRYIRIEIQLEYPRGNKKLKAEIEARQPQLRDAVIGIIQRKTREFLLSPDGKESLRREILKRINQYMSVPVTNVYITDFLIE